MWAILFRRFCHKGASSAIAKMISLQNVHTIVTMMMTIRRARRTRRKRKKRRTRRPSSRRRRVVHMWSLRIVMLPQVMTMTVMMTRPPRRRLFQALLSMRSLLSSTLY
jgi:hypothetical protein